MKKILFTFLFTFSCSSQADWVEYSTRENGDVHYFDSARVQKNEDQIRVWNRVLYKTSVMGASSYQSLMKLDCAGNTETTLQSTFYSDKVWNDPAMATNMKEKPAITISAKSATKQLADILCRK